MSEPKFTPGPWAHKRTTLDICRGIVSVETVAAIQISPEGRDELAVAYLPVADEQVAEANAQLIAAAPDLLKALKMYTACCGNTAAAVDRQSVMEAWTAALDAIVKAEGRAV